MCFLSSKPNKIKGFLTITIVLLFVLSLLSCAYADDELILHISGDSEFSDDEHGYLTLEHMSDNAFTWDGELIVLQDYDGTPTPGASRITYKVDKDFIGDDDNYFDLTIEYVDNGIGTILVQSSTDPDNTMDYGTTGYGGYAEEAWWSWGPDASIYNIVHSMTATGEVKTHTFHLTNEFFEEGEDNYIHIYFGRDVNFEDYLHIKGITLQKRIIKIDSASTITDDHSPVIGNVYTKDNFGMEISFFNTKDEYVWINYEFRVIDNNGVMRVYTSDSDIYIEAKSSFVRGVSQPEECGTYTIYVHVEESEGSQFSEDEEIRFSIINEDLSGNYNSFVGLNSFYGNGGWATDRHIDNVIDLSEKLGVNNVRTFVNGNSINYDVNIDDFGNTLGRYEDTLAKLIDYNQEILFNCDPREPEYTIDTDTGYIIDEDLETLIGYTVDLYSDFATLYGDDVDYYEILNEWDLIRPQVSPQQFAKLTIETAIAIKNIDPDAYVVACCANKVPVYANDDYSEYSTDSWIGQILGTEVEVDEDLDGNPNAMVTVMDVVDAISVHPYTENLNTAPEIGANGLPSAYESLKNLRELIEYYKEEFGITKNVPIWITEFGYLVLNYRVTEREQAQYLTRFLLLGLANSSEETLNIEKMYIWSFNETGRSNNLQGVPMGIVDPYYNNNRKSATREVEMAGRESYVALNEFNYLLSNAEFVDSNCGDGSTEECNFIKFVDADAEKTIYAIWNSLDDDVDGTLEIIKGDYEILDTFGNLISDGTNDSDSIDVEYSAMPKYVVVDGIECNHDLEHVDAVEETCTESGNIEYWFCSNCECYFEDEEVENEIAEEDTIIPPTGHYLEHVDAVEETCTESGNIEYWFCSNCECYFEDEEAENEIAEEDTIIPPTGHYLEHVDAVEETCTESGNIEYWYCSICECYFEDEEAENEIAEEDTIIPPAGHELEHVEEVLPTCTESGNVEYWYCSNCECYFEDEEAENEIAEEDTIVPPAGHDLEHVEEVLPTCTESGNVEYWYCTTCETKFLDEEAQYDVNTVIVPPTGHDFSDWKVTKEATTTQAGSKERRCSRCNEVEIEEIPKKDNGGSTGGSSSGGGITKNVTYRITTKIGEGGNISPKNPSVTKKDNQVFTITANIGYEIADVLVDGTSVGSINRFTFMNVNSNHTIEAKFKKIGTTEDDQAKWNNPFNDVDENEWYYDNVRFVVENGLFKGITTTQFGPNQNITRGMLVTVLYRLAKAETTEKSTFDDVSKDEYYSAPIAWAAKNGIVNGVGDNKFDPDAYITRQDLATIIYRYMKTLGKGFTDSWMFLLDFNDRAEIEEYAYESICYLTMNEIIKGKPGKLIDPNRLATRAETAAIIQRVVEFLGK